MTRTKNQTSDAIPMPENTQPSSCGPRRASSTRPVTGQRGSVPSWVGSLLGLVLFLILINVSSEEELYLIYFKNLKHKTSDDQPVGRTTEFFSRLEAVMLLLA